MFSRLKVSFFSRLDVRLTVSSTIILLCLALGLCAFCYIRLGQILDKQVDKILIDEVHELTDDILESRTVAEGCLRFEDDVARRKYYLFDFRVFDASGGLLFRSKRAAQMPFPEFDDHRRDFTTLRVPGKSAVYRLYERRITFDERPELYVQILTETRQNRELLDRFYENLLLSFPVVLVLSLLCGMLAARKPRQIIKKIARVAGKITSENLQERLPVPPAADEVQELTITINAMIEGLEKSFSEIKQFTADVSHELRNPLFALKGSMEVALGEQREPQEYRDTMAECLERVDFLIRVVNDLFLISRFETRKVNLDLSFLNMGEMVRDLCDFFLPMAQEKGIRFSLERCDDVVICGDKTRVLQLVSNLIENAIKFTPQGEQVIVILAQDNRDAQLQVRDTGIGIPESEIRHIFNRFYQVDAARSGPARGTGLGLQICKRIAEAHGGMISVEPNVNRGVTFTVMLPANAEM